MGSISYTIKNSNLANFRSASRVPITSLKARFLPIQEGEGTPSPENIREIHGWNALEVYKGINQEDTNKKTFSVTFPVLGKNKFDKNQTTDGYRIEQGSGKNYSASGYYISSFIPVAVGATYTKNSPTVDAYHRFATYSDANINSFIREVNDSNSITIEEGESYIRFCGLITEKDTAQLELGTETTTYEPYDSNNTLLGGYVDIVKGELVQEWDVFTPTECYDMGGQTYVRTNPIGAFGSVIATEGVCNMLVSSSATPQELPSNTFKVHNSKGQNAAQAVLNVAGLEKSKEVYDNWLADLNAAGTPLKIYYKLTNPIIYPLTPVQLKTFLDQNAIWSNTNDVTEVSYAIHDSLMIQNAKKRIMAFDSRQPHNLLPKGYTRVTCISAKNATPYINTNITVTQEIGAEIHFYNSKTEGFLFGSRNGTSSSPYCNFNIQKEPDVCRFDYGDKKYGGEGLRYPYKYGEFLFTFHNRIGTMKDLVNNTSFSTDYTDAVFSTPTYPMYLFAVHTGSASSVGVSAGTLAIYRAKFWLGDELVRDYVPCVRDSDNRAGMYDLVNKQFVTSVMSSSNFTVGL